MKKMEAPIYKNMSADIQNENVNHRVDTEGFFNSTATFPVKEISSGSNGNLEIVIEDKPNEELNGYSNINCLSPTKCDSFQITELPNKKTSSPTLIESAIKVMKNLFSPEKVKSNTASVISSNNYSKSPSVSPCISTGITGKTEVFAPGSEIEIHRNVQISPGENNFKNYSQNNEMDILQTPVILDPHNNTDESFMTTVSLIDDSFHSAVTNLDEQGEFIRSGTNGKDNFLNSSQFSDFMVHSNDSLEVNHSCLENTMIKIDNFSSDSIQNANLSVGNKNQVIKNFSITQTDVINSYLDESEKVKVQYNKDPINSEVKGISAEINSEEEVVRDLGYKKSPPLSEMADIYLNRSFVKQTPSEQCKIFLNSFDKNIPKETEENFYPEAETDNSSEIHVESSNNEDSCVNSSISTTTIVLDTGESVDLKTDESGTNISISSFLEDDNGDCWLKKGIPQCNAQSETREYPVARNFCFLRKDQRSCFSEGNSPNRSGPNLAKLNKSDELLNRKMFSEAFEKNINSDKSSLDFSLMKYSEASKVSEKLENVKFPENFKQKNDSKKNKSETESRSNITSTVPLISQQSYTILTVHDKSLNRPVIEPLTISKDFSEQSFQKNDSIQMFLADVETTKKCESDGANVFFDTEDSVKPSQVKQSTPLWEGNNETGAKFFRPTILKLHSPEAPESVCGDTNFMEENNLLSERKKKIFSVNKSIDGFSPVNPDGDTGVEFENSVGGEADKSNKIFKEQNKINRSPGTKKSKKPLENTGEKVVQNLNQTFNKKQSPLKSKDYEKSESRARPPLNQTFEKKLKSSVLKSGSPHEQSQTPKQDKLNVTFDKNTRSANFNESFIRKTRSPEIDEANLALDKLESPGPSLMNKTYDKPASYQLNQTFSKKTESPEPQVLNKTFDKKSESFVLGIQVSDRILESGNESNETLVMDGKKAIEEPNNTVEITESHMLEANSKVDSSISEESETFEKVTEVFKKPFPNQGHLHSTSSFPGPSLLDYRAHSNPECGVNNDANESFMSTKSSNNFSFCSDLSTVVFNEEDGLGNRSIDDLSGKLGKMNLNDNMKQDSDLNLPEGISFLRGVVEEQTLLTEDNLLSSLKDDKLRYDPELVELIREQFSSNDIEKICSVVQDLSSVKLSNDILRASEQFDESFHKNVSNLEYRPPEAALNKEKTLNALSPQSFDFLNSIGGKPTGRDLSRESLYVKFDPLVQPSANSLIDFTKEGEVLTGFDSSENVESTSPVNAHSSSICEQLLTISPQKKPDAIVPPLTPLSHKDKSGSSEDKLERLKELQNEIYFLKNLYAERERSNKTKMEEYENQIAKLTGEGCMLEDKLKNSNEREKSLVKKIKEQTQNIGQLKIIMEEYVKVISKLSSELEAIKSENLRQLEALSFEKDSYMTHLQNTEAAFTDVHAKYEKSKKTIVSLRANEISYRNTITEQAQKIEEFKMKAKEAQEKALMEFQKIQDELNQTKANHSQEAARLKAQLRKTELKLEALQESLDQKIKENQQLTAICDELIEGKK